MANSYRCYFTDEGDRIRSFEQIECPDDAAAALKVDELLASSKYSTAELWQGKRLVGRWATEAGNGGMKQQTRPEQSHGTGSEPRTLHNGTSDRGQESPRGRTIAQDSTHDPAE